MPDITVSYDIEKEDLSGMVKMYYSSHAYKKMTENRIINRAKKTLCGSFRIRKLPETYINFRITNCE